jgi:glycosyltransferase involved in cell wall biosynthesis
MFSIIIPIYNVEPYLRQCLDSVVNQDYFDYEVICINDGSTDHSLAILEEYKKQYPQITLISQENKGLSAARNAGIRAATGDYILFLDSDDWLEKDAIRMLRDNIGDEDMLCFNGRRYFEDGTQEEPDAGITESNLTGWDYYNKYALVSRKFHFVCVVLRLYRKQFLLDHRLFFEEGIYHEDNLFTPIACYYAQKVKVIPDCLYVYRIRNESITHTISFQNVVDMVIGTNLLSDFFIHKQNINKTQIYRELAGKYIRVFYPDLVSLCGKRHTEIRKLVNWDSFRIMAKYPRQKRLYYLIRTQSFFLLVYLKIETFMKDKLYHH